MNKIIALCLLLFHSSAFTQTLSPLRSVDWTLAGLRDTSSKGFVEIDMQARGAVGDGVVENDSIISEVLSSIAEPGAILNFPSGNFLFTKSIDVPNHTIIRGRGADQTTFTMNLGGKGHSFRIGGSINAKDTTSFVASSKKDDDVIMVADATRFSAGDWVKIIQDDSTLVTSTWAVNSVGQVVQIKGIANNKIMLASPLRMDFMTERSPYIVKLNPAENTGIECLKIHRLDGTAPQQSTNISFSYAVNCWVTGIESENCTFSHIQATGSSNLLISKSYFHHAFEYGGGGRAYGVMLQSTSNECLVENNIFEHLRHSMIVQSGANGNVFTYNYSFDPYWDSAPTDAAGDAVLHGNYPYANLFEHNICQNIVIDNSHGPNGPNNTFLRNRAEGFGIFFSASNSPNQNFLGNEIPNTRFPYSFLNYNILGEGHFIYANNNKGSTHPTGTDQLIDTSYAYRKRPDFVPLAQWARIGKPYDMGSAFIPAYDRQVSGDVFINACGQLLLSHQRPNEKRENALVYPNPIQLNLHIESAEYIRSLKVVNAMGQAVHAVSHVGFSQTIQTRNWKPGIYLIMIEFSGNQFKRELVVKTATD